MARDVTTGVAPPNGFLEIWSGRTGNGNVTDESNGGRDKRDKESRREGICDVAQNVNQVRCVALDPGAIPLCSLLS